MKKQVDPKQLDKTVRELRERAAAHRDYIKGHETRTRVLLIDPLLRELGWAPENPDEVQLEFKAAKRTPDYALMVEGTAVAVIEAKRLGTNLGSGVQVQVIQYIKDPACSQISLVAFTNGDDWTICRESGDWKDEKVRISADQTFETAFNLVDCLSASSFVGPVDPPPPGTWVPLPNADLMRRPSRIRFEYGSPQAASSWPNVYLEVCRHVVDGGLVKPDDFPVVVARAKQVRKCAMNTEPVHPHGKDFVRPVKIRDGVWMENNVGLRKTYKQYSIRILEKFGVEPMTVRIEYAPT